MGKIYQVFVHGLRGEKKIIDLCNTEEEMKSLTVKQLKEKIVKTFPETADETAIRLIFADRMLEGDCDQLSMYGIQHLSLIQMVIKVPGGQPSRGDQLPILLFHSNQLYI